MRVFRAILMLMAVILLLAPGLALVQEAGEEAREETQEPARGRSPLDMTVEEKVEVRSGSVTTTVTANATGTRIGANNKTNYSVPLPPEPGEVHPWFLIDSVAWVGDRLSLVPAMSGNFPEEQPPMILAYGCPPEAGEKTLADGKLVREGGDIQRGVPIHWFDLGEEPIVDPTECEWLVARLSAPLEPGLWDFYAPSFHGELPEIPTLTFRIRPSAEEPGAAVDSAAR
jgi:hypothetical protein